MATTISNKSIKKISHIPISNQSHTFSEIKYSTNNKANAQNDKRKSINFYLLLPLKSIKANGSN